MEDLHQNIRDGENIELQIREHPFLDIAEWTKGGKSLIHAAAEAGNLRALNQLIKKVNIKRGIPHPEILSVLGESEVRYSVNFLLAQLRRITFAALVPRFYIYRGTLNRFIRG